MLSECPSDQELSVLLLFRFSPFHDKADYQCGRCDNDHAAHNAGSNDQPHIERLSILIITEGS